MCHCGPMQRRELPRGLDDEPRDRVAPVQEIAESGGRVASVGYDDVAEDCEGYGDMKRPDDSVRALGFAPRERNFEASWNALRRTATANGVSQGRTGLETLLRVRVDIPELSASSDELIGV